MITDKFVYLAGAIFKADDQQANAWRDEATRFLSAVGIRAVNPMRRDYRGREHIDPHALVMADLHDIETCDALLVNASKPSWGTAMEVFFAHQNDVPVVAFCYSARSPWLVHHCQHIESSLAEACYRLVGVLSE